MTAGRSDRWVKLYAKALDSSLFTEMSPVCLKVFFICLLEANYQDKLWWDGKQEILIPRGSFVTSILSLAQRYDLTRQKIRTALRSLSLSQRITNDSTNRLTNNYTIISVLNYNKFQGGDDFVQPTDQPMVQPTKKPTPNQRLTTTVEGVEVVEEAEEAEQGRESESSASVSRTGKANGFPPPPDHDLNILARIQVAVEGWPFPIGLDMGIRLACELVTDAVNPEATLRTLEMNLPAWTQHYRAQPKQFRRRLDNLVRDGDWKHSAPEPESATEPDHRSRKPPTPQQRLLAKLEAEAKEKGRCQ